MHATIIVYNIGGYHAARLRAAEALFSRNGSQVTCIEIAAETGEHPWGAIPKPSFVHTLVDYEAGVTPEHDYKSAVHQKLNRLRPDVVAIPGWGFDYSRAALSWCRKNNKRSVLMSESKYDDAPRSFFKELIKRFRYVRSFDAALVGGSKHKNYLQLLGMSSARIHLGYDVVDNDYFTHEVSRIRNNPSTLVPLAGRKYFLAANRFIARKNVSRLIDAYHSVASKSNLDWDLVLLGQGPEEAELKDQVVQLKLTDRVHFPGFVSYNTIPYWFAFAGAFIHPALAEQWGLVVNEAMASGLPILLSRACGCYPELLEEGVNGFSFDPSNVEEMAGAMTRIADLPEAGGRSLERIAGFSPQHFAEGLASACGLSFAPKAN